MKDQGSIKAVQRKYKGKIEEIAVSAASTIREKEKGNPGPPGEKNATGGAIDDCCPGSAPVFFKIQRSIDSGQPAAPVFFGARFFFRDAYVLPNGPASQLLHMDE